MENQEAPQTPEQSQAPEAPSPMKEKVVAALRTCYDPEIPVNIYDLGLVYNVAIDPENVVNIKMTLTSPHCPVAGSLPLEVQTKAATVDGIKAARVDLVWDPPWTPAMMTEAAKLELGMM